jgi:CRISPR system Cascade subunit CasD
VTAFLRFTLYAPVASWGEPAVGEIRSSWDRPSRSAVLGLLAAALGITRDDDGGHARLDASVGVAVRLLAAGEPLMDYHTTQNPRESLLRKRAPATRREALAMGEPATALSARWLRQDALALIALWLKPGATLTVSQLEAALCEPAFTLYAGRKANALGLPLSPALVQSQSLAEALREAPVLPESFERLRPRGGWGREVSHDLCEDFDAGLVAERSAVRRDAAPVRSRWQFSDRTVYFGRIPPRTQS